MFIKEMYRENVKNSSYKNYNATLFKLTILIEFKVKLRNI